MQDTWSIVFANAGPLEYLTVVSRGSATSAAVAVQVCPIIGVESGRLSTERIDIYKANGWLFELGAAYEVPVPSSSERLRKSKRSAPTKVAQQSLLGQLSLGQPAQLPSYA